MIQHAYMRLGYTENFRDSGDTVVFGWKPLAQLLWQCVFPMVKINIWLILFTLPVFTFAPALTSAYGCCVDLIRGKEISFRTYVNMIRHDFVRSWGVLISVVLPAGLSGLCSFFYFSHIQGHIWLFIPGLFFCAVTLTAALMLPYALTMENRVNLTFKQVIKDAFLLAFLNLKFSFCNMLITVLILFLSIVYWIKALPLTISITIGLVIMLNTYFSIYGIQKYVLTEQL